MPPDLHEEIQSALRDTYTIERELSGGGMSRVFLGVETSLGRRVVLKVLAGEHADRVSADRFAREVRLVAQLQHPQIVPLFTAGVAAGSPYYTMPFVEGESLGARLTRDRRLPTHTAIGILRDVAKALEYAHAHGVIHRDIKPDNVLLSGSSAAVADFGIAKALTASRVQVVPDEPSTSLTQLGTSVGTPAYMSPEQAAGDPADHRADLYSWGVIAYEMLAGSHPFAHRRTAQQMLAAQISEIPAPLHERNDALPRELASLVMHCLAKDPNARVQSATELLARMDAVSALDASAHRPSWTLRQLAATGVAVVVVAAALTTFIVHRNRVAWARDVGVPQINRLADEAKTEEAFTLATQVRALLPSDSSVRRAWRRASQPLTVKSDPAARVYRQAYPNAKDPWQLIGTTPIESLAVPAGWSRLKLEADGFAPYYVVGGATGSRVVKLRKNGADTSGGEMLSIPGGTVSFSQTMPGLGHLEARTVANYQFGRFEVTNREFKRFVAAGGYSRRELWDDRMERAGQPVSWDNAMKLFVDRTGRAGPSTWEVGDYPQGQADYPVTGVSWYEASAYARFVHKKLPTIYHWVRAASPGPHSGQIIALSNIEGKGLATVGSFPAISFYGAFDVAGNAREWCVNANGHDRFVLGGAWNDPAYMFYLANHQDPMNRAAENGIRLADYSDTLAATLEAPVETHMRNFAAERPVSDAIFSVYRRLYDYDRGPLNAKVERVDTAENWIRQRVTFAAAYGSERVIAYMYLPRDGHPPFQAVVIWGGASSIGNAQDEPTVLPGAFLPKSGRALLYPIYKGTFERRDSLREGNFYPNPSGAYRDHVIMWGKDLRRSVDYLYSRTDVDTARLAYHGVSWGASMGAIMPAIEPRLKAAVLQCPGIALERPQPEVDALNFLPRVTIPVLMVSGKYDAVFPLESSAQPMFRLLGTAQDRKRQVITETGHCPPANTFVTEALTWLDKYLGPVRAPPPP